MAHYADNGHPWRGGSEAAAMKALTNGILVWPVSLSHGLVDNRDWRRVFIVVVVEVAAAHQWDAHGFEVSGHHGALIGFGSPLVWGNGLGVERGGTGSALAAERKRGDGASGFHAGQP